MAMAETVLTWIGILRFVSSLSAEVVGAAVWPPAVHRALDSFSCGALSGEDLVRGGSV